MPILKMKGNPVTDFDYLIMAVPGHGEVTNIVNTGPTLSSDTWTFEQTGDYTFKLNDADDSVWSVKYKSTWSKSRRILAQVSNLHQEKERLCIRSTSLGQLCRGTRNHSKLYSRRRPDRRAAGVPVTYVVPHHQVSQEPLDGQPPSGSLFRELCNSGAVALSGQLLAAVLKCGWARGIFNCESSHR